MEKITIPEEKKEAFKTFLEENAGERIASCPSFGSGWSGSVKDSYQELQVTYSATAGSEPIWTVELYRTNSSLEKKLGTLLERREG